VNGGGGRCPVTPRIREEEAESRRRKNPASPREDVLAGRTSVLPREGDGGREREERFGENTSNVEKG
jgi:hypothetical protein